MPGKWYKQEEIDRIISLFKDNKPVNEIKEIITSEFGNNRPIKSLNYIYKVYTLKENNTVSESES